MGESCSVALLAELPDLNSAWCSINISPLRGFSDSLLKESVGKKLISPCKLRDLRVSVLKLLRKRSTTEARRTRRNLFPTTS